MRWGREPKGPSPRSSLSIGSSGEIEPTDDHSSNSLFTLYKITFDETTILRWCYTERFVTTIFSATQHYNIVATLFRTAAILFQHCNTVLRKKSSLRIVSCNITFATPIKFDSVSRAMTAKKSAERSAVRSEFLFCVLNPLHFCILVSVFVVAQAR